MNQSLSRNCTAISNFPLLTGLDRTTSQRCTCPRDPFTAGISIWHVSPTAKLSRSKNETPLNDRSRVKTSCVELALGP
jgi:hypothetical protein